MLVASLLQLRPMELPNKRIRDRTMIRTTREIQKDHKVDFRIKMGKEDKQEAVAVLKKEEFRITADKRMIGLKIQTMDQAKEEMI